MKKIFVSIAILLALSLFQEVSANSLRVIDYDISNFPAVKARLFQFDETGKPLNNLEAINYAVSDNGTPLTLQYVQCSSEHKPERNSIVFSFDKGISAGDTSLQYFKLARRIFDSISSRINYDLTDVAVTSFDLWSYLLLDFSSDKAKVASSLGLLRHSPSSSCNAGLISLPAGAIPIFNTENSRRSVILITQGVADFASSEIITQAQAQNVAIYIVYLGKTIPEELKNVSIGTGGRYFDNVKPSTDIMPVIYSIMSLIEGYKPCEFMWYGNYDCLEEHSIEITDKTSNQSAKFDFEITETDKPTFVSNPPYLEYTSVPIGESMTQEIIVQAINTDIVVTKFSIANPAFEIIEGSISSPKIIYKNTTHKLSIRYTPIDSAIVFTKLIIESNACFGTEIYITGGFPNRPPKTKTIELVSPKCGETLVIGDSAEVRWQGLLPKDVIQLEYSLDFGGTWFGLAKNIENLAYNWEIPNVETDGLLIRAIQMWPNNVGRTLDLKHRAQVNSAFFNKIGDRVITAADDSCAVIWNSNNGEKVHILKHPHKTVNYAVFDQAGKFAFTACANGFVYMYDAELGSLIRSFRHDGSSDALSVEVSPSGDRFVSVSKDGYVYIWSINGPQIKKIDLSGENPNFAVFDKTGQKVLVTTQLGIARFYNFNGEPINSFDTKNPGELSALSRHGTFSQDGSKIAVVNDPNESVFVFDVASGNKLYSLKHTSGSSKIYINSSSFFYNPDDDTEYILTAGSDNSIRRWLASDGSVPKGTDGKDTLHLFREHSKPVQTAVFNFDGSRLLSSSWDSTAKIWNLNQRDLQMDSTDCFIAIGKAEIEPIDIDFGDVLIDDVSTITQGFIRNLKNFKFNIRNIRFFGGDIDDFQIIDEMEFPMILGASELKTISIRFQPKGAGLRKTFAEVIIPNDTLIIEIFGYGIDVGLHSSTYLIDFGRVEIDEFKDSTFTTLLTNRSGDVITIDSVYLDGPDNEHFDIAQMPQIPIVLAPGQSIDATFRFIPETLGRLNGIVVFEHDGKGTPTRINLFGNGIGTIRDTFSIVLTDFQAKPGESAVLPLKLRRLSSHGAFHRLSAVRASLSFNATLLEPIGNFNSDIIIGNKRTISFDIPYDQTAEEIDFNINFKTGLGNDSLSKMDLFDIQPIDNAKIIISGNEATFKLLNICNEGGSRLFDQHTGRIYLMQNKPNPFSDRTTIDFEIIERGTSKLTIYDMTGLKAKEVFNEMREAGAYSIELSASDFAAGMYYYILETPSQRFFKTMQVVK